MRVYRRGKRGIWWVDITVDGERVKRSAGTTDRRQAEEYAAALARDLWRTKRLGEAPRVTWDVACLEWLREHQHRRSIEDIKLRLRWLTDRLAGKPLASITDAEIRLLASARKAQEVGPGKPSSNATVNRHMAQLSAVLHYAQTRGWLPVVPPIAMLPEPAKRVAWITPEQARRLMLELPSHLRPMAGFALATGLRESNIRLLCWSQVDLDRRVAWVHADQAKGGKNINVPLNDEAVEVLLHQIGKHSRWVFPVPRAGFVDEAPTGKISNHAWRKACTRAGLPTLRFHDLRHTWASWHVQAGTPLAVLQELGGWSSYQMVLKYSHLAESHIAQWAGNIGTTSGQLPVPSVGAHRPGRKSMGWLTGLEPATTGITIGSHRGSVRHIKGIRKPKVA